MPINVSNVHWYLAVVKVGENNVKLNIINNIDMRNKDAEEILMNIARRYRQRMIAQRSRAQVEINENTPTPRKTGLPKQDITNKAKEKINCRLDFTPTGAKGIEEVIRHEKTNLNDSMQEDETDSLEFRTPNQLDYMQNSAGENSEYTQPSQNREEQLHRTGQLQNNISHCVKINYSKCEEKTEMDDTEEVIYSEGEPFEGYLYPNNTWDSDDSMYKEDYSPTNGRWV